MLSTGNDPNEIEAKIKAALESNEDMDTVFALGASLAGEAAVSAVGAIGRKGELRITSFDLSADFLKARGGW